MHPEFGQQIQIREGKHIHWELGKEVFQTDKEGSRTSLVVRWLSLCTSTCRVHEFSP